MSLHAHDHSHPHPHAAHTHTHDNRGRALYLALALTFGFAIVEAVGGWWAQSLALLGDAGHMFSDAMALGLSAAALWLSRRPPSARHSYGLARAEIVAALANGLIMLAVVVGIVVEAIGRLLNPQPVAAGTVVVIALIGLLVNVLVLFALTRGESDMNIRGAILHVMGDLMGSVAALLAGAVIYFTGWLPVDALLSLVICALILFSTFQLIREALHVLMEGVPRHLDLAAVGRAMAQLPGALSIHDLHIWTVASGRLALSAHVVVKDFTNWTVLLTAQRAMLRERFAIEHVTLQPELGQAFQPGAFTSVIPIHPRDAAGDVGGDR